MKSRKLSIILFALLALTLGGSFFYSRLAQAEKLTVVDSKGLTRAVREVKGPAVVTITVKKGSQAATNLISVDGFGSISSEDGGEQNGKKVRRFSNVASGRWKIQGEGSEREIARVEIRE